MLLLLVVIYLTFISLGLPDSLFGAAWPVMHIDLGVKESFASAYMIITAVCSGGVSFLAGPLIRKFGTGAVTIVSVGLTVIGIAVVGFANHIVVALIGSIIMGYGAGAIDTGLNNFVANHYKASQMNWLHCFWGIGVTVSPLIMSVFLGENNDWHGGYRAVSLIQSCILLVLLFSIPLWKKYDKREVLSADSVAPTETTENAVNNIETEVSTAVPVKKQSAVVRAFKIKGVPYAVASLGFYCGMEFLLGTWGASYMVNVKAVTPAVAAKWISLYYGGIMIGRFISGFISMKLNDKNMIRLGECVALIGIIWFSLPIGNAALIGLLVIGIGFGPIFPSTLHSTPDRFGTELSADITGYQMGGGYGIAWMIQLIFGFVAPATTFAFLPFLLLALCALLLFATETVNKLTIKKI